MFCFNTVAAFEFMESNFQLLFALLIFDRLLSLLFIIFGAELQIVIPYFIVYLSLVPYQNLKTIVLPHDHVDFFFIVLILSD